MAPVAALAIALGVLALGSVPGVSGDQATGRQAPRSANPTRTAQPLVHRFFVHIQNKDRVGLKRFLSPAFQLQRADGSGAGKRQYLANLPTINKFEITRLRATQARAAVIVRYLADVRGRREREALYNGGLRRGSRFSFGTQAPAGCCARDPSTPSAAR
jgi:hypothetical protein